MQHLQVATLFTKQVMSCRQVVIIGKTIKQTGSYTLIYVHNLCKVCHATNVTGPVKIGHVRYIIIAYFSNL